MAEDVSILEEPLVDDILTQLVNLEVSNSSLVSSNIHRQVSRSLRNLSETNFQDQALKRLKTVTDSASDQVRFQSHLSVLGEKNEAITALLAILNNADNDSNIRLSAAFSLRNFGNTSEKITDTLLEMLKSKDADVSSRAAFTLGQLGKTSQMITNSLLKMLKDEDSYVSFRAAFTLGELGNTSEEVTNVLLGMLEDKDSEASSEASFRLRHLGKTSEKVIDAIVQWIDQHRNSRYVGNGVDILWALVAEEAN
jgi:HEAT repeat protein